MRSCRRSAALIGTLVLLAGCGVQGDAAPRPLAPDDVPDELLAPSTTSNGPEEPRAGTTRTVWLVDNEGCLADVERRLEGPTGVLSVVRSLLEGATDEEAEAGLRSDIPPSTETTGVDAVDGENVQLDLSEDFAGVTAENSLRAQAQLVYTVTSALPAVEGVIFLVEGEPLEGTDDQGQLTAAPLKQADFTDFTERCAGSVAA
ncbi:MAG: GerMN domain-containing protein [Acidimicrobiia bacterium]|nr:GerMN domain-containing protein [Acidimicrobiia bacterium]